MARPDLVRALYRGAQERETYFDLTAQPSLSISQSHLDSLAGHLKFESILRYVAFPKITFTGVRNITPQNYRGLWDMAEIFEWLRRNGVEKILSIIVYDNVEPSHSDAAIEGALVVKDKPNGSSIETFDIETWDWQKLDINCDVIADCAPNVEEISLYSSGNNAVLMGWSSTKGLYDKKKFPKLRKVNLIYEEGLEDDSRLRTYVYNFKTQIETMTKNIISVNSVPDKRKVYMQHAKKGKGEVNIVTIHHEWLESSNDFRKAINNIVDHQIKLNPIKIAVIDNGVNIALNALKGKIEAGASFFPSSSTDDIYYHPYYTTSGTLNHGSLMATLVCKMCPKAKLYICRLEEKQSRTGNRYITMESATKALEWAMDQKVDVICMSWTIEDSTSNVDTQDKFRAALGKADNNGKGIIMVSAASDQGGNSTKTWPGESGTCIRIGASTATGDRSLFVHQRDMDFLFPGEGVPLEANEDLLPMERTYDGSSVATAIAAGTAGLLLYLDRLAEKWGGDDTWAPLQGRSAMKRMFEMMSETENKCPSLRKFNEPEFQPLAFKVYKEDSCQRLGQILGPLKVGKKHI
ncbi:peptidase S8/S53 domain-containing protein [Trichoderma sp. SZMC 28012]